ncbi:Exporter protein, RND family [hydrothermal vent metagenome]|uniref:Exporter protein, RND family n=1 Tax=hydrothermal vent metagenome TaxID=652676 RepID=A0A3B0V4R8_9ZZZZ
MSNNNSAIVNFLQNIIFNNKKLILLILTLTTILMGYYASQLKVDAGFKKQLPLQHEYMKTFMDYETEFGGANRLLIAIMTKDGDMFNPSFFETLEAVTDDIFSIKGVSPASVTSIFTPNVRFVEVVEDGFAGGNVIPADFAPTPEMFEIVKGNIVKAGVMGRLVAENFNGAMVWAELLEEDPVSGEKINYQDVAAQLESIRQKHEHGNEQVLHVIGFAKIVGDISDGAKSVLYFFAFALLITAVLLYWYSGNIKLTIFPLLCSVTAVIWQLGILKMLGFGIDPMNILTPFLIFAIGVSHGVQMISTWTDNIICHVKGKWNAENAAKYTFAALLAPGSIALLSDTIGFATIYFIDIRIIQELAITATIGVALIIITNLILMPILLSMINTSNFGKFCERCLYKKNKDSKFWRAIAGFAKNPLATLSVFVLFGLFVFGYIKSQDMKIGDSQTGVPELRPDAKYNTDAKTISSEFSLGVDMISVIAESSANACTESFKAMEFIDRFAWHMENVPGVQKVITLSQFAKVLTAGWNEGNPKWKTISRNEYIMRQSLSSIETDTGLLNKDCSSMPIMIFTEDHKATTINTVVAAVQEFRSKYPPKTDDKLTAAVATVRAFDKSDSSSIKALIDAVNLLGDEPPERFRNIADATYNLDLDKAKDVDYLAEEVDTYNLNNPAALTQLDELAEGEVRLRLATGNVGVMAATNDVVKAAQMPMLILVYAAIIVLCLFTFRTLLGTLAIVVPLALVSFLAYALMAFMGIGLKVNTLPVVALGVGIGVDYGIYIFSKMQEFLKQGKNLYDAYYATLRLTGKAVFFTAVTLAVGVGTWMFSDLQFQADMGVLLAFMFVLNMLGALLILPSLAYWLMPKYRKAA